MRERFFFRRCNSSQIPTLLTILAGYLINIVKCLLNTRAEPNSKFYADFWTNGDEFDQGRFDHRSQRAAPNDPTASMVTPDWPSQ